MLNPMSRPSAILLLFRLFFHEPAMFCLIQYNVKEAKHYQAIGLNDKTLKSWPMAQKIKFVIT